tara:strand:+ start:1235 stop:1447 length:213 start_codon:yes stop_codon:yes gene_type:complete
MKNIEKFWKAISILKSGVELSVIGEIDTEEDFNKIKWKTGENSNGTAIETTTNPHSELTWTKVKAEMDKL